MADESKAWDRQDPERIKQELQDNHIWINAFSALNPSDEMLREVGLSVLSFVKESHLRDGLGISRTALIRVNAS